MPANFTPGLLYVGLDFGTTGSAVAFTGTNFPNRNPFGTIRYIQRWGAADPSLHEAKVPSLISYAVDNHNNQRWGLQVRAQPGRTTCSLFKLQLDRHAPLTELDDGFLNTHTATGIFEVPDGMSAQDVTADFLGCLYRHTLRSLRSRGTTIPRLHFYLPVPARWSDAAETAIKVAAVRAGFEDRQGDRLWLMKEPEAALYFALHFGGQKFEPGDGVLVADLGGGTADVTAMRVQSMDPIPEFQQITSMQGAKCGGTAIDRRFLELLNTRYGAAFQTLSPEVKGPASALLTEFEELKRRFTGTERELEFFIPFHDASGTPILAVNRGTVVLSHADLQDLFDPVIKKIGKLICSQLGAANENSGHPLVKNIVLVGGLAASPYVQYRLREAFTVEGKVTVFVPHNPQLAVAIGATLRARFGDPPRMVTPPLHYGFEIPRSFRRGEDPEARAVRNPLNGEMMLSGTASWVLIKGTRYPEDYNHVVTTYKAFTSGAPVIIPVYVCQQEVAPESIANERVAVTTSIWLNVGMLDLDQFARPTLAGTTEYVLPLEIQTMFSQSRDDIIFIVRVEETVIARHEWRMKDADIYRRPVIY